MVDACKKHNVRLMEGFMFRFHPQHAKVREIIESGAIGEILKVEACFGFPMPTSGNIIDSKLGGGAYNDAIPYPIYASRMIFGEEPVRALCSMNMDQKLGVSTRADMILEFKSGKSAIVSSIFGAYYQSYYRILGTKGTLRTERAFPVPNEREVKLFLERDDKEEVFSIPPANQFRLMVDDFCAEVSLGSAAEKKYEDDLVAQACVLDAGRMSYEGGCSVNLSEIDP